MIGADRAHHAQRTSDCRNRTDDYRACVEQRLFEQHGDRRFVLDEEHAPALEPSVQREFHQHIAPLGRGKPCEIWRSPI